MSGNGGYFRYLYVGVLGSNPNPKKRCFKANREYVSKLFGITYRRRYGD